jgi:hypothetical protein
MSKSCIIIIGEAVKIIGKAEATAIPVNVRTTTSVFLNSSYSVHTQELLIS